MWNGHDHVASWQSIKVGDAVHVAEFGVEEWQGMVLSVRECSEITLLGVLGEQGIEWVDEFDCHPAEWED
jgi:hypothetical protein